jgi:hypothetical protein
MFKPSILHVQSPGERTTERVEQGERWGPWAIQGHDGQVTFRDDHRNMLTIEWRMGKPGRQVLVTNLSTGQAMARALVGLESWVKLYDREDARDRAPSGLPWPKEDGWLLVLLGGKEILIPEFILAETAIFLDACQRLRAPDPLARLMVADETFGRIKANETISAYVHDAHKRWLMDVLSRCVEMPPMGIVMGQAQLDRIRDLACVPYEDLDEGEKDRLRAEAVLIQRVFIGEDEDEENKQHGNP